MLATVRHNNRSAAISSNKVLLILGAPRSGTTLLAAMVGSHPDIAILHEETSLAMRLILGKSCTGVKLCIPNHIRLSERASIFYRPLMKIKGLRRLAMYMVESKYSIRDYHDMFPALQVLLVVRAPDRVLSSIQQHIKCPKSYAEYCYRHAIRTMWTLVQENSSERTKVVSFDSLVTKPETVMRDICAWLGYSFDGLMLSGYKHTPQYHHQYIDSSKASRQGRETFFDREPYLKKMYSELCSQSL